MKDFEQMYYDLLYEYKKAINKIENLELKLEILSKYKDVEIKKMLVEQIIEFKKKNK